MGSGTVGVSCKLLNRSFIGIELNKEYFCMAKSRIENAIEICGINKEVEKKNKEEKVH